MKSGFIEKLITRLDRVDPGKVQGFLANLLREKGFLEQVFEALHEGVIILDPDGTVSFLNRAATRFFGIGEEAVGKSLNALVRGLDWNQLTELHQKGGTLTRDLEVFYPENRILNFYLSPISDELAEVETELAQPEAPLGWVMLIRDITESRAEAAETLEHEKLSALTLLAAGVAHEIGNPLNSLNIHLQLLSRKIEKLPIGDQPDLEKHVTTARDEVERLDHILKDFLQAIRPSNPDQDPRKNENLNHIIEDTLQTLETELTSHNARVHLHLEKKLPTLPLNRPQIQQALFNLIRNAQQALPAENGEITLITQSTPYEVSLTIKDNGSGIPPELMGTLYEPFQSTKESGTGLGLLIVRRIIREHGGHLDVQSTESQGTTITLSFPRHDKRVQLLEEPTDSAIEV